jgi:glutamine amidotransferase
MIGIINYDMGNLTSIIGALEYLNECYKILREPKEIECADKVILPGVGSFYKAMEIITSRGIDVALSEIVYVKKKPLLGICLGMQLLATDGEEGGFCKGLNYIDANIRKINATGSNLKIPHVGFNSVEFNDRSIMFNGIKSGTDFYFIHSYRMICNVPDVIAGTTVYGEKFVSAVEKGNVWGCQFHPEKSQRNGIRLLKNFVEL